MFLWSLLQRASCFPNARLSAPRVTNVVSRISCSVCGEANIKEAGRPLRERLKDYLAGANHSNAQQMPWTKHSCQKHANKTIPLIFSQPNISIFFTVGHFESPERLSIPVLTFVHFSLFFLLLLMQMMMALYAETPNIIPQDYKRKLPRLQWFVNTRKPIILTLWQW